MSSSRYSFATFGDVTSYVMTPTTDSIAGKPIWNGGVRGIRIYHIEGSLVVSFKGFG